MSEIFDDSHDHDESLFVQRKKKSNVIDDSDDDSSENQESNLEQSSGINDSTVISETDDEESVVLISEDEDVPVANNPFMTPQQKKHQISCSDSDGSGGEPDSDVIEDSFESAENNDREKERRGVTPRRQIVETKKQPTLDSFVQKLTVSDSTISEDSTSQSFEDEIIRCNQKEYNEQMDTINNLERQMMKTKTILSTFKLSKLSDGGQLLKDQFEKVKTDFLLAQKRLKNMVIIDGGSPIQEIGAKPSFSQNWTNIKAGIAAVQPKTFGRKGLETHTAEKALTFERLAQLHGSLKNCPDEEHMEDDPPALKVALRDHQKRALAWLIYRETQKPSGGILADDMGLGKTLTMLSLMLKTLRLEEEDSEERRDSLDKSHRKFKGGTLVVCPASLIHQWAGEIDSKIKRGTISYNVYHGPKREVKPKRLAEHDVVITTYSIVMNEQESNGAIFRVKWKRVVLDEAHQIRNYKSKTSVACCELTAKKRWALTGTPVHNKELDMYSLLKFLRCSPFDDISVWKRWVGDKSSGGGERLSTVISSLMLRRTKSELMNEGKLTGMPSRKFDLIPIELDEDEMGLYQKILLFSQTLFAQFLHQRAENNQDIANLRTPNVDPNGEYFKMRQKLLKLNKMREVNQHEILVLLLRLRQICCHPSLITNMLQGDDDLGDGVTNERDEINLLEQLNKLNLEDDDHTKDESSVNLGLAKEAVGVNEAAKGILNPSHPIFAKDRISSKIKAVMDILTKILSAGDKVIIVSQWSKFLELVGLHLKKTDIKFLKLDGSVPTAKRTDIVTTFNDKHSKLNVLLLSLTAGGVGLNLVGANHLLLIDLHWNPQLENQAQDRIYRMGQEKNVNVYKFMTSETIEERIKNLQENKLTIANNMLTGSKQVVGNKLSLQDLKMLFNM